MNDCGILIDTNQVLHFQPIDQIDWLSLTQSKRCVIVIAPILLRELERKKIFSPSATLRDRAGRMIEFLVAKSAMNDPIILRPGVELAFIEHEPALDFAAHRLVREVDDDHYIASALDWEAQTGLATFIASNDGGMTLKLRSRSVTALRLPETLRLPSEIDADQKALRDAKREIAQMKASRPKLALRFADGTAKREIRNASSIPIDVPGIAEVRAATPLMPLPGARFEPPQRTGGLVIPNALSWDPPNRRENVEKYNSELLRYYTRYEKYLGELDDWTEMFRLRAQVKLTLLNDGSATATDIDVTVRFPDNCIPLAMEDFPDEPRRPRPPARPGLGSTLARWAGGDDGPRFPDLADRFKLADPESPYIDGADPQAVQFSVKTLKQKCDRTFEPFFLVRVPDLLGKGIEVDVTISYHEGQPVQDKLAITFSEVAAEDSDD